MSFPGMATQGCTLAVSVFDGTRQPMPSDKQVLFTVRDGNQKTIYREFQGPQIVLSKLPFYNNFGDHYAVIAHTDGHEQAGFVPVKVSPNAPQRVDLMLLKKDASYNFGGATWKILQAKRPALARALAADATDANVARDRYREQVENRTAPLACLLNVATALDQINLRQGTPIDYVKQIVQDETMKQDRIFAYADPALLEMVQEAAQAGLFAPEHGAAIFHPGATASYKQLQFGEANVQITFHEDDRKTIDSVDCLKIELDIDYFKDLGAHALLEVVRNRTTGSLTDPRQVCVLRWIAGRRAGVPEFDPLYTIV